MKQLIYFSALVTKTLLSLLLILFLLLLCVWGFSPHLIRALIDWQLHPQQLNLDQNSYIRINPFKGHITIKQLGLLANETQIAYLEQAEFDIDLLALRHRQLKLDVASINGLQLPLAYDNNALTIPGLTLNNATASAEQTATTEPQTEPWSVSIASINLSNIALPISLQENTVDVDFTSIKLSHIELNTTPQATQLTLQLVLEASINQASLNIESQFQYAGEQINNTVSAKLRNFDTSLLTITPELNAFAPSGTVDISLNNTLSFNTNSAELKLDTQALNINGAQLTLDLETDKTLSIDTLAIQLDNTSTLPINDAARLESNGELTIIANKLSLVDSQQSVFIAWDSFNSPQTQYHYQDQTPSVKAAKIQWDGLSLMQGLQHQALVKNANIRLNDLDANPSHIQLKAIDLAGGSVHVTFDEKGQLQEWLELEPSSSTDTTASTGTNKTEDATELATSSKQPAQSSTASLPSITIDSISTSQALQLTLNDFGHTPTLRQQWQIDTLSIGPVHYPDADFTTELALAMHSSEYATITLEAQGTPLAAVPTLTLNGTIKELNLAPFSYYIEPVLGIVIKAGQLDQSIDIAINKGQIDGDSSLYLRSLSLASPQSLSTDALAGGTALSLNQALNMLKNSDGHIRLKVPLHGDINDPKFGLQGFTRLVIKRAALRAAKSYLIDSFVPYAKVVKLAVAGSEQLFKLRFEPMPLPQHAESETVRAWDQEQQAFIAQLGQLMTDKPKPLLQICPITNSDQQLDLVNRYAKQLKQSLVTTHGVQSERLLLCTPSVKSKAEPPNQLLFSFK